MEEIVHALGIEWKHLLAQIVNFGILAFVLFKLVYKPLLKVIDERIEKTKEADLKSSSIDDKLAEIKELEKKTLDEARVMSKKILADTEKNAESLSKRLDEEAHARIKKLEEAGAKKIAEERDVFIADHKKQAVENVAIALEKSNKENLDASTKSKITESAVKEVEQLVKK